MARGRDYYRRLAMQAAQEAGIDPNIFARQIQAESNFDPTAGSSAGAIGIAQIMPATARGWGVNPRDPQAALRASAHAMAKYVKNYGGWRNALVAYNAGPGRVGKPMYSETANYVNKILGGSNPKGGSGVPSRVPPARAATAPPAQDNSAALDFLFMGSPLEGMFSGMQQTPPTAMDSPRPQGAKGVRRSVGGNGAPGRIGNNPFRVLPRRKGEAAWHYLQRLGNAGGLRNDPGNRQTTGGGHTDGSYNYRGQAIDFGNGANSMEKLNKWYQFIDANRGQLGVAQLLHESPGTSNEHMHVALNRGATK